MEEGLCIHGVSHPTLVPGSSLTGAIRAIGLRVADGAPVHFTLRPSPRHEGTLSTPEGLQAKHIALVPQTGEGDGPTCLVFGDYPQCCLSRVGGYQDVLLVDTRDQTSTDAEWPDIWKIGRAGEVVDRDGCACGKIDTAAPAASLVLTNAGIKREDVRVCDRPGDCPQPHPWRRGDTTHHPQILRIDGHEVPIPGGPYTILEDGGGGPDLCCIGVDDLAAVLFAPTDAGGQNKGAGPARFVYVGDEITGASPYKQTPGENATVCLTMIIRNEGKTIRRALENARAVADKFCICDTGSTDNTLEEVKGFLRDTGCKGRVLSHPFRDFGYNRTVSWVAARGMATYQLFIDADHVVQARSDFDKNALTEASYIVLQNTHGCTYWNLRLARDDAIEGCCGVTHEFWKSSEPPAKLDKLRIIDVADGGAKANKFERDLRLL